MDTSSVGRWGAAAILPTFLGAMLGGCAATPSLQPATPTPTTSAEAQLREGVVEFDGVRVSYQCVGDGSPIVILEAGSDSRGTSSFPAAMITPIADVTMVCTYDRLGTGGRSSSPPEHARTFVDLVQVLDGVVSALNLRPPYVLVGQSGGGNLAIAYAAEYPDRVGGLVTIEAYHDEPSTMAAWQAEEGFTWEDNPEHFDVVSASTELDNLTLPIGEFPVVIVSATSADPGGPENQAYWLGLSPNSRQVVIEGPHDLQLSSPDELAAVITDLVVEVQGP